MSMKIKGLILLVCAVGVLGLAASFFSRATPLKVQFIMLTPKMVEENQKAIEAAKTKRENAMAEKERAELEKKMYQCQTHNECIIVDKDPCGCFKGPEGVTAINAAYSLEFSRLLQEQSAVAEVCPAVASEERECSESARPVCRRNACTIIY